MSTKYNAPDPPSDSFSVKIIDCDPEPYYFTSAADDSLWQATVEIDGTHTLSIPQGRHPDSAECGDFIFVITDRDGLPADQFYTQAADKEVVIAPQ